MYVKYVKMILEILTKTRTVQHLTNADLPEHMVLSERNVLI